MLPKYGGMFSLVCSIFGMLGITQSFETNRDAGDLNLRKNFFMSVPAQPRKMCLYCGCAFQKPVMWMVPKPRRYATSCSIRSTRTTLYRGQGLLSQKAPESKSDFRVLSS